MAPRKRVRHAGTTPGEVWLSLLVLLRGALAPALDQAVHSQRH